MTLRRAVKGWAYPDLFAPVGALIAKTGIRGIGEPIYIVPAAQYEALIKLKKERRK